jgi:energy-coupling factor transporter ATP-binding protein EcfA2
VGSLPYGLQKRVELGRALVFNPRFLLLDEPVAGMNETEGAELPGYIVDVNRRLRITARCCVNSVTVASSSKRRVLNGPDGDRHAEAPRPVQRIASVLRLSLLIAQSSSVKTPAEDRLVSRHRSFDQAPAVVARAAPSGRRPVSGPTSTPRVAKPLT